jgi:hypothetical protein
LQNGFGPIAGLIAAPEEARREGREGLAYGAPDVLGGLHIPHGSPDVVVTAPALHLGDVDPRECEPRDAGIAEPAKAHVHRGRRVLREPGAGHLRFGEVGAECPSTFERPPLAHEREER